MSEHTSSGWKLAAVLGGLLCATAGAIATGAVFHYGLVKDIGTVQARQAVSIAERAALRTDVNKVDTTLELMRKQIAGLERAINRLADAQCVANTGHICPREATDERP